VIIDCTAIPETLFESVLFGHAKGAFTGASTEQPGLLRPADGGTVFLDEIGELPLASQSKLLRLIQHATFTPVGSATAVSIDVRFIAATNRDLLEEVRRERFRKDLFYRLAVVPLTVPPLRERRDDVLPLAEYFLKTDGDAQSRLALTFSPQVLDCFTRYTWPGNIRELRNVIDHARTFARSAMIELEDLPAPLNQRPAEFAGLTTSSRDLALAQADREYLIDLLRSNGGNISRAAGAAGVTRQGIYKLLHKHGIAPSEFRSSFSGQ
jgi:transcriptional regulator with PAS, ATPase and Fis domain